jgi:hypothetical protein
MPEAFSTTQLGELEVLECIVTLYYVVNISPLQTKMVKKL